MADAWSVSISGDISSYGLSGQITYTEGVSMGSSNIVALVGGLCGNSIGAGFNTIGPVPQKTLQYSQAANILTSGSIQTSLGNIDPIIYVSYAPSRANMLGFMGGAGLPGLKLRDGGSEFGDAGWQAIDILTDLQGYGGGSFLNLMGCNLSLGTGGFGYHVGYYRVEPYADILGEFKKLYAGLPVIIQFDPVYNSYVPKLAPFMSVGINYETQTNLSIKFVPEKKVSIIVRGQLGKPDPESYWGGATTVNVTQNCPNIVFDTPFSTEWGDATPEGKARRDAFTPAAMLVGTLSGSAKVDYTTKLVTFTDSVESGSSINKAFTLTGERYEILSRIGTPISTLWSRTQRIQQNIIAGTTTGGLTTTTYQAHNVKLFSHGESSLEVQAITLATRTLTVGEVEDYDNTGVKKKMPMSYNVMFDMYEDIFSDVKQSISMDTSTGGIGRKMQQVSIQYLPFTVERPAWEAWNGSGNLAGVNAFTSPHGFNDTNKYLVFFEVSRSIKHYDPIGNSGYKSNTVTIRTNPINRNQDIDIQDAGDASNFSSVTPIGPGYSKIIGKYGAGEPIFVSIPVCVKDEAMSYAENVHSYHNGYYQVTKIHEEPICGDAPDYSMYIGAFERPGMIGSYGLVVSANQTVTPFKNTVTTTYRYYV